MLNFAMEVSRAAHDIGKMDNIAIKVAAAEDSREMQVTVSRASDMLYSVIDKRASEDPVEQPNTYGIPNCIAKMASYLGKPELGIGQIMKLAAVVAADNAINNVLAQETNPVEQQKLASMRFYGREYFVSLLREVL